MAKSQGRRFTLQERSWIMYDWANSVYATNIMAAIFPIVFGTMARTAGVKGDQLLSYGVSIATGVVALMAPILGAVADFKGMKKKLFTAFWLLGVVATALIALTNDYRVMLAGYVLSRIGFSGSTLFYDSFLTDVTTNERMDKVSTWGYAMGYIGGSTIPFLVSIGVLLALDYSPFAQKFSILITSIWWFVFTIPFLKNVHQEHYIEHHEGFSVGGVFKNIGRTARDIVSNKGLMMFMLSYFFYIDGVGTIINISTAYGTALGLNSTAMILALLVTQIVAMPCSILFGRLTQRITARRALLFAIAVYMIICSVGFIMGYTLEPHQAAYDSAYEAHAALQADTVGDTFADKQAAREAIEDYLAAAKEPAATRNAKKLSALELTLPEAAEADSALLPAATQTLQAATQAFIDNNADVIDAQQNARQFSSILFWAMAVLVGTVQGGIQAVSRSFFGKLIPKHRSNEFFGFFDIFGKFASVLGPFLYAAVGSMTGRSSWGTLCLLALFIIGFIILYRAKAPLEQLTANAD